MSLDPKAFTVLAVSILLIAGCREDAPGERAPGQNANAQPPLPKVEGAVVYEREQGIWKTGIGEKEGVLLAREGSYPRWSPDGRQIAFVRGNQILRMDADGGSVETLATAGNPRAVAWRPNGREVLFTDGSAVRSVSPDDRKVRTILTGQVFRELDVSEDGLRLVATVKGRGYHVVAFDLAGGGQRPLARGCSASLSPDAQFVTSNEGDHRKLAIRSWETGERVATVRAPSGRKFDNQFWSNHPDWLVSRTEGEQANVFIHHVPSDRAVQVTFSGGCDRPDLFVSRAGR